MLSQEKQSTESPLDMIAGAISAATGISIVRMKGNQRNKPVWEARRLFSEMAHSLGFSQTEIGRYLGKDHTTIGYYLRGKSCQK